MRPCAPLPRSQARRPGGPRGPHPFAHPRHPGHGVRDFLRVRDGGRLPLQGIAMQKRKLLGSASNLATRVLVYLAQDAVEIDEVEGYSGIRKRVLFDEVLLVTLDRRRRMGTL